MTPWTPCAGRLSAEMRFEATQRGLRAATLCARYGFPEDGVGVLRRGDLETVDLDVGERREFLEHSLSARYIPRQAGEAYSILGFPPELLDDGVDRRRLACPRYTSDVYLVSSGSPSKTAHSQRHPPPPPSTPSSTLPSTSTNSFSRHGKLSGVAPTCSSLSARW